MAYHAVELSSKEPYEILPEPERRLLLAILEDAASCYIHGQPRAGVGTSREAEKWIWGRGRQTVLSFQTVCETLGFDAQAFRRGLMRLKASKPPSHGGRRLRKPYRGQL